MSTTYGQMKKNYIRTSIGFSQDQYNYLEKLAIEKQESIATIIRDLVNKHMKA